jgi:hypothetical protein
MATAVPGASAPPGHAADEPHARGLPGEPDAPDLPGRPPGRRRLTEAGRARLLVLLAVVAAALVRAPVPEAGLPFVHHPDEPPNIVRVERMVAEGTLHPGNFLYPAVMYDVSAAFLAATDHEVIAIQTPGNSKAVRPNLVVGLRWVVGLLPGLATVVAAGALGWMGSRRSWVAGGAAAVLALSPLDVRFGPLVTPDAIAGAATALAVVGALWVLARPRAVRYVVAGVAVGIAASTKYNTAIAAAPVLVAHGLALGRQRAVRRAWLVLLTGVVSVAVFLVINPYSVIDTDAFVSGLRYNMRHYRTGHPGSEGGSLGYHLAWLWRGFGPTLLLAPLGLLLRRRRERQAAIVCLSFVVLYVGFISSFEVRFARNLMPVSASLAGAIALGALAVVERTAPWRTRADGAGPAGRADRAGRGVGGWVGRHGRVVAAVCCVALLAWPALGTRDSIDAATADHWPAAQRWIDDHFLPRSRIAVASYGVYVDRGRYRVTPVKSLIHHDIRWYRDHNIELIVASEQHFHRLISQPSRYPDKAAAFQALLAETCVRYAVGPEDAQVLLLDPHPC